MKFSLKNIFSKKKLTHRHTFRLMYPEREWFGGIILTLLVFGGCAAYAGIIFLTSTERIDIGITGEAVSQGVVYDREGVARVLKEYTARAERFSTLQKDAPVPLEPGASATTSAVTTQKTAEQKATSTPELQTGDLQVE